MLYLGDHAAPGKIFAKLDAIFKPHISYFLQFLANRISIFATRTLCEVVIADYTQFSGHCSYIWKACPRSKNICSESEIAS